MRLPREHLTQEALLMSSVIKQHLPVVPMLADRSPAPQAERTRACNTFRRCLERTACFCDRHTGLIDYDYMAKQETDFIWWHRECYVERQGMLDGSVWLRPAEYVRERRAPLLSAQEEAYGTLPTMLARSEEEEEDILWDW